MSQIKLFSGTSHPQLAKEVAAQLDLPLSKAEILRFSDSECKVTIQEDVKNQTCIIIQPTCDPTDMNLMELFLFGDALKRSEAKRVIAVIPLFGYARQNTQHRQGECISMHVVAKILETIGFDEIYTFDLHEVASSGIFSVPFFNLSPCDAFAPEVKKFLGTELTKDNIVMASPDQEGIERARALGECFFGKTDFATAEVEKRRNLDKIHESEALNLYGDVKDKVVIIVDDICTSGGTLIHAAQLCLDKGAKKVVAVITHHDFAKGVAEKLQNSPLEAFFTTDTIPLKKEDSFAKLREVSVASLIAVKFKTP